MELRQASLLLDFKWNVIATDNFLFQLVYNYKQCNCNDALNESSMCLGYT